MNGINVREHYNYLENKYLLYALNRFKNMTKDYSSKEEMIFNLGYSCKALEDITETREIYFGQPNPKNIKTTIKDVVDFLNTKMEDEAIQTVLDFLHEQINNIKEDPKEFYKYVEFYTTHLILLTNDYKTKGIMGDKITACWLRMCTEDFIYLIKYYIKNDKKANRIIEILNIKSKDPDYRYKLMKKWDEEDAKEKRKKEEFEADRKAHEREWKKELEEEEKEKEEIEEYKKAFNVKD